MSFTTVIMPTDFSECSAVAFHHAVKLAQRDGAEFVLVHAVEPQHHYGMYGMDAVAVPRDIEEKVRLAAETKMKNMLAECPEGLKARFCIRGGSPATEIAAVAAESEDPVVVVSTHGYTGWRKFLLGSTTERIVRLAHCPVLTIPAEKGVADSA